MACWASGACTAIAAGVRRRRCRPPNVWHHVAYTYDPRTNLSVLVRRRRGRRRRGERPGRPNPDGGLAGQLRRIQPALHRPHGRGPRLERHADGGPDRRRSARTPRRAPWPGWSRTGPSTTRPAAVVFWTRRATATWSPSATASPSECPPAWSPTPRSHLLKRRRQAGRRAQPQHGRRAQAAGRGGGDFVRPREQNGVQSQERRQPGSRRPQTAARHRRARRRPAACPTSAWRCPAPAREAAPRRPTAHRRPRRRPPSAEREAPTSIGTRSSRPSRPPIEKLIRGSNPTPNVAATGPSRYAARSSPPIASIDALAATAGAPSSRTPPSSRSRRGGGGGAGGGTTTGGGGGGGGSGGA